MALAGSCSAKISTSRMNFLNRLSQESEGCWIIAATSRAAGAQDYIAINFKNLNHSILISRRSSIAPSGWAVIRGHKLPAE